jgi:phosphoserine aminotransferase
MARVYNFNAGPAALPQVVLEQVRDELLDWHGSGMSVMEMSHRGKEFMAIAAQAEQDLRELLAIPENYKVLFLQGGATTQFAMVPLNLMGEGRRADYIHTGAWSKKAISEAKKFGAVNIAASGEESGFAAIPPQSAWRLDSEAAYVHYTPNETIGGVEFHWIPETGGVPLVGDFSSTLLSRPVDVSRFGLIYAGAQKNVGPAGVTLVIVREDLVGHALPGTPTILDYAPQVENDSMYNTPATFSWYVAGLVFAHLKAQGGLAAMAEINQRKAKLLYRTIDESGFYRNPVAIADRSWMNVPFILPDAALDATFLSEAKAAGLLGLKGHRSVGGMRASIYNAVSYEAVETLAAFMKDFQQRHG